MTPIRTLPAIAVLATLLVPPVLSGQDQERTAVLRTVQRFFDAMAAPDTTAARAAMLMDGRYYGVRQGPEGVQLSGDTHEAFVRGLATRPEALLERMWDPQVMIHGTIAVVWTPYDFHTGGRFSHCGVDAFSLIRTDDGWKIAGIVFTVEPTGCAPSPLGQPR